MQFIFRKAGRTQDPVDTLKKSSPQRREVAGEKASVENLEEIQKKRLDTFTAKKRPGAGGEVIEKEHQKRWGG